MANGNWQNLNGLDIKPMAIAVADKVSMMRLIKYPPNERWNKPYNLWVSK